MSNNMVESASVDTTTSDVDTAPECDAVADTDGGDRGASNKEAAKYRRQLREAEATRDALGDRLAAMQRDRVATLAADHLADGADIWRDGLDLADLLDEEGNLDLAKVAEAARASLKTHPHWARPARVVKRNPASVGAGLRSGASGTSEVSGVSWAGVLNTRAGN